MNLTHARIKAAAADLDGIHEVQVRSFTGPEIQGRRCVSIVCGDVASLLAFGMSLAVVFGDQYAPCSILAGIQDEISVLPVMRMHLANGALIAYWPAVAIDPEVAL